MVFGLRGTLIVTLIAMIALCGCEEGHKFIGRRVVARESGGRSDSG